MPIYEIETYITVAEQRARQQTQQQVTSYSEISDEELKRIGGV